MGSSESKESPPVDPLQQALRRQKALLEAEKLAWQQQQIREQHWKEQQLREEQRLQEAQREWVRQAEITALKTQQAGMKMELEKQKAERQLEQKRLLEKLEEERKQREKLEEERKQREKMEQEERVRQMKEGNTGRVLKPLTRRAKSPATCLRPWAPIPMRETVAVQQRTTTFVPTRPDPNSSPKPTLTKEEQQLIKKVLQHQQRNQQVAGGDAAAVDAGTTNSSPSMIRQPCPSEPKIATPKSYLTRMREANVRCTEWSIVDYVVEKNQINAEVAGNIMKLLDDGNTVPFVARYRRHSTQGMDEERLRQVRRSYEEARAIKRHAVAIVKDVEAKGQWTPEFHALVHEAKSLDDLEDIGAVFRSPRFGKKAADLGLEIVAEACLNKKSLPIAALVNESTEGLKSEQQVRNGISKLLADTIIRDKRTFDALRKLRSECAMTIETFKGKDAGKLKRRENKYESYYNFTSLAGDLTPRQVFDIDTGESLKALGVRIIIPEEFERKFKESCQRRYEFPESAPPSLNKTLVDAAIDLAYSRSIKRLVAKRARKEIDDRAQNTAMWGDDGLARNIKRHLLKPPVRGKVVVGICSDLVAGCKFAVVAADGAVLDTGTIYPNDAANPNGKRQANRALVQMIGKYNCEIIALGNGRAVRETEEFLTFLMKDKNVPPNVFYTIVDEDGASMYSNSRAAALEFPRVDPKIVSAVSIARRLQDPMAELVKIEPELLTGSIYRRDLSRDQIIADITEIIVEAVSYVGVDANTASLDLLKKVAGMDDAIANAIVERRQTIGPFTNRNDLLKVKGMNKRIFDQVVGFIRIDPATAVGEQKEPRDTFDCLDQTWIHPDDYSVANAFLKPCFSFANCNADQMGTSSFISAINLYAQTNSTILAKKHGATAETIELIVQALSMKKGQDVRGEKDIAVFRRSIILYGDLNTGDVLIGTIKNLETFGAFVDVGAEVDGLIHKNYMNGATVEIGQKVEVRVSRIDRQRGRLGLTFIKCV